MDCHDWSACFPAMLASLHGEQFAIDSAAVRYGVNAYLVRTFDGGALQFSIPVVIPRSLHEEIPLDPAGADGAVHCMIERIKRKSDSVPALYPVAGKGTEHPHHHTANVEPYTVIHSPHAIAAHLWCADAKNHADAYGVHLAIRGAVPAPPSPDDPAVRGLAEQFCALLEAVGTEVFSSPARELESAWRMSLDQKLLRHRLPELGLVCFVADGSRPARTFTRHRCWFRTAGPKEGVNIPFNCPAELGPVEVDLPAGNRTVTGLGIRKKEVFAVAGSNAQGKSTFLEGIVAGMDDHAAGDGREFLVTVRGVRGAEATGCELAGADISMFFASLPPGVNGPVHAVSGQGSGSMGMACQVQEAVRKGAPVLVIDEDRAAPNLLVRSCIQSAEITPLSEIIARQRALLGDTALVLAACAMDTLVAEADRIMLLEQHEARAVDPAAFRTMVRESLLRTAEQIRRRSDST